jgi:hypothetical protein
MPISRFILIIWNCGKSYFTGITFIPVLTARGCKDAFCIAQLWGRLLLLIHPTFGILVDTCSELERSLLRCQQLKKPIH